MMAIQPLDVVALSAPLGVRFVDSLTSRFIADGLRVTAYPSSQPSLRCTARLNRSNVYVFHELPGLRRFEFSDVAISGSWSQPAQPFTVEVVDEFARFLPCSFAVQLPERGIFQLDCPGGGVSSALVPGSDLRAVALYSASTRQLESSFAVVRAELWDAIACRPAAWAVVEVQAGGGSLVRGLCDERGSVALFFPYPEPVDLPAGSISSLFPLSPPLSAQSWPVELSAFYRPRLQIPAIPDLCGTLGQPPAALWADSARSQPLGTLELKYGRELSVRTTDGSKPLANLWVTPA
jgi:hypothetical protein